MNSACRSAFPETPRLSNHRFVTCPAQVQATWCHSHPVVTALPFGTSFNAGAGRGWFQDGRLATQAPAAAGGRSDVLQQQQEQQQQQESGTDTGGVLGADGWFNMLLTDTLPTCRDAITQQVS